MVAVTCILLALESRVLAGETCASCDAGEAAGRWPGHAVGAARRAGDPVPLGDPMTTELTCASCHDFRRSDDAKRLRADLGVPNQGLDRVTRLCLSCHRQAGETRGMLGHFIRHPVGVRPRMEAWAQGALPLLDADGRHDPVGGVVGS